VTGIDRRGWSGDVDGGLRSSEIRRTSYDRPRVDRMSRVVRDYNADKSNSYSDVTQSHTDT